MADPESAPTGSTAPNSACPIAVCHYSHVTNCNKPSNAILRPNFIVYIEGGSVAEWLACWTQAQKGNSLRQTVHTHHASVHQAAKLVATLLRVARVTVGLAESNGSLPPGL